MEISLYGRTIRRSRIHLIYLLFLVILGLPIIVCEFSVGRASQKSIATSYNVLEPKGTRWHFTRWFAIAGNYLLVMFYSMVGGWMLYYCFRMAKGEFAGIDSTVVSAKYDSMLESPVTLTFWTILVILLAFGSVASVFKKVSKRS